MINENLIVVLLNESYKLKLQYKQLYDCCTDKNERQTYRNAYLKALDIYSARYQMLLLCGYDVVFDENSNIISIEKI